MAGFNPVGSTPVGAIGSAVSVVPGGLIFHGSNVTPNQWQITSGHLLFGGATPTAVFAAPRVTWFGVEALHAGFAYSRVSWFGVEVLRAVSTHPTQSVVTWMGLEVLHSGVAASKVSWIGAEVLHTGAAKSRVSWIGVEVLRSIAGRPLDRGWVSRIAA
jgi:hypothetical protein